MRRNAAAAAAGLLPLACAAQPVAWHLEVANDVAFHTDRWYTSGVRLYRSAALDAGSPVASFLRLPSAGAQRLDFGVIQDVYTSDPYAAPEVPDRPNAARLLFSAARHDLSADTLATLGIDAGVSGPAARGEQAQRLVHRIVPAPKTDWTRCPVRRPRRISGSIDAKCSATQSAVSSAERPCISCRSRFVSCPVSMPTGQAVAQRPSAAHVSSAS